MKVLFEVTLFGDVNINDLLTEETKQDTGAQIMTEEQAASVILAAGVPESGRVRAFIVCNRSDVRRIQNALEAHEGVAGFQVYELE